jgi:hypothetical protein
MTTEGRGWGLVLLCVWAPSCARPASPPTAATPSRAPATGFPDDPDRLPRYHSKRLALWLPLPRGARWRIDDHSRPELSATQELTRSRVVVAVLHTDSLVGRSQCEDQALDLKLVPNRPLQTVDDEVALTQSTFDTRIRVAIAAPEHEGAPLVGHVLAFGGYLRKCYVFDFSTEVDDVADEPTLSARLAFARTRILGGLELEGVGALPARASDAEIEPR